MIFHSVTKYKVLLSIFGYGSVKKYFLTAILHAEFCKWKTESN